MAKIHYNPLVYGNTLTRERIMLLGNDPVTARSLKRVAEKQHFRVCYGTDHRNFDKVCGLKPRLIVLDFTGVQPDNFTVCARLKRDVQLADVPVVILNKELVKTRHILKALELGAEDYLVKPIDTNLLVAKIRAILRRTRLQETPEEILKYKQELLMNLTTHQVLVRNQPVKLTAKEFSLLYFLMKNPGNILKRMFLMEHVWGNKYIGDTRTINKHIETLRRKLGPSRHLIHTVEGIGYKFNP